MRKTAIRNRLTAIVAGLATLGSIYVGRTMIGQHTKIEQLEQELTRSQQKVMTSQLERDNYRKLLIYHGNPEGWQADGDSFTGEAYFSRLNGDGCGSYWTEYLK